MSNFYQKLCDAIGAASVREQEPMSAHTTFRAGGPARYFVTPEGEKELAAVLAACREAEKAYYILGNGSNLLVSDAAVMNAGAYGGELKDVLESVRVMTPDGEVKELKTEELDLGYRHSCIPERGYIVLSARIRLEKGDPEAIRVRMDELAAKRREKQPLEYPSAGSTFKRPEGYFAGKLIEDAGLRGYQEGGAQVSEKHCGFVINRDHATASDIAGLCGTVQKRVYEQFGVKLETEVKMLGF